MSWLRGRRLPPGDPPPRETVRALVGSLEKATPSGGCTHVVKLHATIPAPGPMPPGDPAPCGRSLGPGGEPILPWCVPRRPGVGRRAGTHCCACDYTSIDRHTKSSKGTIHRRNRDRAGARARQDQVLVGEESVGQADQPIQLNTRGLEGGEGVRSATAGLRKGEQWGGCRTRPPGRPRVSLCIALHAFALR